ncbi:MAG: YceI family protein [Putridiphycobacter sp.]|nr:YceI family protein [Putridiphycobacter sp.]
MKKIIAITLLVGLSFVGFGQKYLTQTGQINFYSFAEKEDITAVNNQVSSVLNTENGELAFSLLMKAFSFEKALMQEHFNEKYVESDKYPKATFKGSIIDFDAAKITDKATTVKVQGKLTIHGVTKDITTTGTLQKTSSGNIIAKASFIINLDDYNIAIPSAVKNKVSNKIEIKVNLEYEKMG